MFQTMMPNNLFFAGAFPNLTSAAVLALSRHYWLALMQARREKKTNPFEVIYSAPTLRIADSYKVGRRANWHLRQAGLIELIHESPGKPPQYQLTNTLKVSLERTTKDIWLDRTGRPRTRKTEIVKLPAKLPCPKGTDCPKRTGKPCPKRLGWSVQKGQGQFKSFIKESTIKQKEG